MHDASYRMVFMAAQYTWWVCVVFWKLLTNTSQFLFILQDDIRRVKRDLDKTGTEKADLTSKIEELNLHNDSSQRELARLIKGKQDKMVDENILKLEIKRLRDILNSRADEVLSLEKRRLQLETVSKKRKLVTDWKTVINKMFYFANHNPHLGTEIMVFCPNAVQGWGVKW